MPGARRRRTRWLRRLATRRGDRRLRAVGARGRHRRRQPADAGRRRRRAATASAAARSGSPTPRPRRSRSCSRARGPGLRGQGVTAFLVPMDTPGITRTARADSLGVRGLGCMDLDLDVEVGDDQVLGAVDQGFRLAMWALQGGRVGDRGAGARHRRGGASPRRSRYAKTREHVRPADRQLPGDSVDARRRGDRARSGAAC